MLAVTLSLLLSAVPARGAARAPGSLSACVHYDDRDPERPQDGRLHAVMLENLLGHFRELRVRLVPLSRYRAGGLSACDRAAYVGTRFDAPLPEAFLRDVAARRAPFLWVNYNVHRLSAAMGREAFRAKTGFEYGAIRAFDGPPGADGVPGFFRYFDYKGQRLEKRAARRKDGRLVAAPEIAGVRAAGARVLASAVHSTTGETLPYVTEKDGFFFVADNPFLFAHEQDRYLILADVLFDFLRLPPRERGRRALVRLEDVHPRYDVRLLYEAVKVFKRRRIPFAVSLVPVHVRPGRAEEDGLPLGRRRAFLRALRYARRNGGEILLHGYTHSVSGLAGCPALGTPADYEFWDRCRNRPLPHDSDGFARRRVSRGRALVEAAGLSAVAWVTPHYAASARDFVQFGRVFDRTVQRVSYALEEGETGGQEPVYVSQFFPYTIYKDHYGQFVWPENLGFVPMPGSDWGVETPPDVAVSAAKASVVRDGWASFFWHPELANTPGGLRRLEEVLDAVQTRGYVFVSLRELRARGE